MINEGQFLGGWAWAVGMGTKTDQHQMPPRLLDLVGMFARKRVPSGTALCPITTKSIVLDACSAYRVPP